MRVAVIDLGTNTFNLLIAEVAAGSKPQQVFRTRIPVRFGDKINEGFIDNKAYQRGIAAIKEFHVQLEKYKPQRAEAFATSAIRSSVNGKEFCDDVTELTGITVNVINGEQEAELIYYGVKSALEIGKEPSLILDIGGGSNEFIIGNKDEIFWKKSFNLGIARLLSKFKPSDPIQESELTQVIEFLETELDELFMAVKKFPVKELIGASGSFETFAELAAVNFRNRFEWLNGSEFIFNEGEYGKVFAMLLHSTKQDRSAMRGMLEMRSDMIVLAGILVDLIIRKCNLQKIRVSDYSLQEGALFEILKS